ncbi:E3 ubiquitin-protein ligase makorin-1-like [Pyxicephalus adspersus]|uniref:E3 ubiquitin-protein ligase makorin-1-like n=1 Tax=Pyxicephalus adspersus TaxID=30357 RepID=UPI003B5A9B6E
MAEALAVPVALTPVVVGRSPLIPFLEISLWQLDKRSYLQVDISFAASAKTQTTVAIHTILPLATPKWFADFIYMGPVFMDTPAAPSGQDIQQAELLANLKKQICPYAAVGRCRYGVKCVYSHGDLCEICGLWILHPTDMVRRSEHIKLCIEAHEKDMAIQHSKDSKDIKDVLCGICMEVVYERPNITKRSFGVMPNCKHCYCLTCIQRWTDAKQRGNRLIKSCPECQIKSNPVIPSEYWVVGKDEKETLMQKYKEAMRNKSCQYFDEGSGKCPFGDNCFYKHEYPDVPLEEPQPQQREDTLSWCPAHLRNVMWEIEKHQRENGNPFSEDDIINFMISEMFSEFL